MQGDAWRGEYDRVVRIPLLACGAALVVALAVVFLQPVDEPWWIHADPDGAYAGSSLNILLGNHTNYLDHPGLPTQDGVALGFGAKYLIDRAGGSVESRQKFVDRQLLNLDRGRLVYRGWAIAVFVGGAALVYWTLALFLGHWTWGLAGSLLYLGAPAIADRAFGLRPDAPLAALCVAIAVLIATAFTRRSAGRYAWAAALLGLALTLKLPAIALIVPLGVAALWRPPEPGWARPLLGRVGSWVRRHGYWLVPLVAAWVYLCVVFNRERLPVFTNDMQRQVVESWGAVLGGFVVFGAIADRLHLPGATRLFSRFTALVVVAFTAGFAVPASLVLDDGIQSVAAMWDSLMGGHVNANIPAFADFTFNSLLEFPIRAATLVLALAIGGAIVGGRRRIWWPMLLVVGALLLAVMAAARLSYPNYYAPAFAVALPPALWLLKAGRASVPLAGWAVVLAVIVPVFLHLDRSVRNEVAVNAAAQDLAGRLLKPGEVILAPYDIPIEDVRYDGLVDGFVDYVPPTYPYRFLQIGSPRLTERHLTPRYYVASAAEISTISPGASVDLGGVSYVLRPLSIHWGPDGGYGVAQIAG
jgi:hypothetical protein